MNITKIVNLAKFAALNYSIPFNPNPLSSSTNPLSFNKDTNTLPFNTNNFPSDVEGTLAASVSFVQNSIIPSRNHIQGDTQPHLTALRKTMVLFQPKEYLDESVPITMTVKNGENQVIGTFSMNQPDRLTKIVEYAADFDGDEDDFKEPGSYSQIISGQTQLNNLKDDPSGNYLKTILNSHNTVKIQTANGAWIPEFHLPAGNELNGKIVTFSSSAGYGSNIYYSGKSLALNEGMTVLFRNFNGTWYTLADIEYSKITYGEGYWSAILSYEKVRPGIQFDFKHSAKSSQLKNVNIGGSSEVILHTIDLGMLTPYRNEFTFQKQSEFHRQYFHQVPISRLIVSEYEPRHFKEVMLPDGTLLKDYDPSTGGVYDGTMRQRIGKELISLGINNANYGIHSSEGQGESGHPYSAAQLTAHNSVGKYVNGVVVHGLSGGGGIVTLQNSIGNEFSHEVGHNYGLGHYPNGFAGSIHRTPDQINSAWGWDSDKDFFIPSFEKSTSNQPTCQDNQCADPFERHSLGRDAMASGQPFFPNSNAFTLHTPYALNSIQKFLESKAVFDRNSPSGFSKWNPTTQKMEAWENKIVTKETKDAAPADVSLAAMRGLLERYDLINISFRDGYYTENIYLPQAASANSGKAVKIKHLAAYNSYLFVNNDKITVSKGSELIYQSTGDTWVKVDAYPIQEAKRPYKQGTAVTTLVGYYDPLNTLQSYIYPALHGSFGMVYESDAAKEINASQYYLQVETASGDKLRYKLNANRIDSSCMNKFHINVEEARNPVKALIMHNGSTLAAIQIDKPATKLSYTVNGVPL